MPENFRLCSTPNVLLNKLPRPSKLGLTIGWACHIMINPGGTLHIKEMQCAACLPARAIANWHCQAQAAVGWLTLTVQANSALNFISPYLLLCPLFPIRFPIAMHFWPVISRIMVLDASVENRIHCSCLRFRNHKQTWAAECLCFSSFCALDNLTWSSCAELISHLSLRYVYIEYVYMAWAVLKGFGFATRLRIACQKELFVKCWLQICTH